MRCEKRPFPVTLPGNRLVQYVSLKYIDVAFSDLYIMDGLMLTVHVCVD